ncbi:MAG: hypothetical protein MRJ52_09585 [Nitrosomonas sp.]|nr:hypothetical protein [Nitrosomonas sp.]
MLLEIMLPDKKEQLAILSRFQRIENEDAELKSELTHQQTLLKKLRQQILQEAIESKLTVDWRAKNPDVEPASELLKQHRRRKSNWSKTRKSKHRNHCRRLRMRKNCLNCRRGWAWCRWKK